MTSSSTEEIHGKDTMLRKLFVGGLPYHTTDETLRVFFEPFGEIDEAVVITDRQTGKSRGYGFVTMKDGAAAERACKDTNPIIDGRKANVNLAYIGAKPRLFPVNDILSSLPFYGLKMATGFSAGYFGIGGVQREFVGLPQLVYPSSYFQPAVSLAYPRITTFESQPYQHHHHQHQQLQQQQQRDPQQLLQLQQLQQLSTSMPNLAVPDYAGNSLYGALPISQQGSPLSAATAGSVFEQFSFPAGARCGALRYAAAAGGAEQAGGVAGGQGVFCGQQLMHFHNGVSGGLVHGRDQRLM